MNIRMSMSHAAGLGPVLLGWTPALGAVCLSAREMTPLDVARQRAVTTVAVSPDGTHFGYLLAVPRRPFVEENGPAWQNI